MQSSSVLKCGALTIIYVEQAITLSLFSKSGVGQPKPHFTDQVWGQPKQVSLHSTPNFLQFIRQLVEDIC